MKVKVLRVGEVSLARDQNIYDWAEMEFELIHFEDIFGFDRWVMAAFWLTRDASVDTWVFT